MSRVDPTYIGQVASVTSAIVRARLREDMPSTLVMINGESYRVGQIGGFFAFHWATQTSMPFAHKSGQMLLLSGVWKVALI